VSLDRLRAVVLTYGAGAEHVPLLESLAGEGLGADRVLLVHNPSAPGERLPSADGYEVIEASHNLGYAAGMNLGLRRQLSRGCDFVLVLTHDARLRSGTLRQLVDAAAASPSYGALGPVLLLAGTETAFSFGGTTTCNGGVAHRREKPLAPNGIAECDWIDGGTMLVSAEALRRAGCFEERFWSYFEDAELCLRVSRAGFRVAVVLAARADQEPGGSKRLGSWAYLMTRNGIAYAHRFAGLRGTIATTAHEALGVVVELLRTLARLAGLRKGLPAEPWAVTVGTLRGIVDFYRGRWGPPPPGLPGSGDIRNLAPVDADAS
jgi:GT2 family glycosyltransferase